MTNEVTGVVALKPGEPVSLETVLVPDPARRSSGPGASVRCLPHRPALQGGWYIG